MKNTATKTDSEFNDTIQRLGFLSQDAGALDAFIDLYVKAMEKIYADMLQPANVNRLLAGEFTAKGETLRAILYRQCEHFNLPIPQDLKAPQ